jgi:hypothetical protein
LRDDYGNLKIYRRKPKDNSTFNYINISKSNNHIVLNQYKTSRLYGKHIIKLDKETRDLILESLKREPRKYLFTTKNGERYAANILSSHIIKIFKFSINDIRRAYINDFISKKHTALQRMNLAKMMTNSVVQQEFTYKRK